MWFLGYLVYSMFKTRIHRTPLRAWERTGTFHKDQSQCARELKSSFEKHREEMRGEREFNKDEQNGKDQRHINLYEEHGENERICDVIEDSHLDRESSDREMLLNCIIRRLRPVVGMPA